MTVIEKLINERREEIMKLRQRVKGLMPQHLYDDDVIFFRFLKARDFNLDAAESMLKKHTEWRKTIQLDDILTDFECPEVLVKYISQYYIGLDKEGNVIKYSAIGNIDGKGLFKSANQVDVLRFCLQSIESDIKILREEARKTGEPMKQCIYIFDMSGLTLAKASDTSSIQTFNIGVNIFQDNYPELLKSIYVINAMHLFAMAFPVVKMVLARSIIGKMKVFGKEGWKEEFLKHIDADVLPTFLGGSRTEPDGNPRCRSLVQFAGQIPREYYLTKNVEVFGSRPGVRKIIVAKQSSFKQTVEVEHPGSIIKFEIETKTNDIGLKVELHRYAAENIVIIPFSQIEMQYEPYIGTIRCKSHGSYVFTFDNSYSWFYSKELYYLITVCKPTIENA